METFTFPKELEPAAHLCPKCRGETYVYRSMLPRRYRKCSECFTTYSTRELTEDVITSLVENAEELALGVPELKQRAVELTQLAYRLNSALYQEERDGSEVSDSRTVAGSD